MQLLTSHYINSTQTKSVLLLGGTAYEAPAALVKDYGSDRWKLLHILRDNLGSITHLVDSAGNVVQELSYTPWGQLRDPETLRPYLPDNQPDLLLDRGFTGHEHLNAFGLVNMNARLYDPAAGRFLNPDPIIQAPDNTQNLNRYTYCLNNPLRYVDESGMNYYFLDPNGWRYKKYENSDDMGVYLPGVVVYGRSTWSRWSSYIESSFIYSWNGDLPNAQDWRQNRFGAPVSSFNELDCFVGGYSKKNNPSSNYYRNLSNTSIVLNSLSSLPTSVETTYDIYVRKKLSIPFLKGVKVSDYAKAFASVNPITKEVQPALDMVKTAKFVKGMGAGLAIGDAVVTGFVAVEDIKNNRYASATARAIVCGATIAVSFVPGVGTVIAFGIGMADALWGQQFYDYVQDTYDNW